MASFLNVTGDAALVTPDVDPPRLFGVLSGKSPSEFGTYFYDRPLIYDHVAVSPGLLDAVAGAMYPIRYRCRLTGLIRSGSIGRRPWRFGSRDDDASGTRIQRPLPRSRDAPGGPGNRGAEADAKNRPALLARFMVEGI